jgi:hypothetical protein
MEAWIWHIVDTGEDICESCFGIDKVQTGGDDQEYGGSAFSAPV